MTGWVSSTVFAGRRYYNFVGGELSRWLTCDEDLYIKFTSGKMKGMVVRVIRDDSYTNDVWDWFNDFGHGININLRVWDGSKEKKIRFIPASYDSATVAGSAMYCVCSEFDPDIPELGMCEDVREVFPLRQDMFGIDIKVGAVINAQISGMSIFAVVEKYNHKSLTLKPIEWNEDLKDMFDGKTITWSRNTSECFVIDSDLSDRLLMARLTTGEH